MLLIEKTNIINFARTLEILTMLNKKAIKKKNIRL